jgi:hypothetical protein
VLFDIVSISKDWVGWDSFIIPLSPMRLSFPSLIVSFVFLAIDLLIAEHVRTLDDEGEVEET